MASQPNTVQVMQAIQYRIFTEVLIGGASPFTPWSAIPNQENPNGVSDLVRFGTNPNGTVTTAISLGFPKVPNLNYPVQCHIIPQIHESVRRESHGGHVFDEKSFLIRLLLDNTKLWYENQQSMCQMRDQLTVMLQRHAELPGTTAVTASKQQTGGGGMPTGFGRELIAGREWDTWGFVWWTREEYTITGGFVS